MFAKFRIKYTIFFFVAIVASTYLTWKLCNYRFLYAIVILGLYFLGGVGFFPFKTGGQRSIGIGVFLGALMGLILYMQCYI